MYAYLRLFRWPNLLVIALTQYLLRYAIIFPVFYNYGITPGLSHFTFFLLVLSTLLITAAGYAINDYFDLRVDRINKPQRIILGREISRRKAIFSHSLLNIMGMIAGVAVSVLAGNWQLSFIFLVIPFLLWMYSVRYKNKYLIGNIIVAVLSAFVVTIVWIFEYQALSPTIEAGHAAIENITGFVRMYAFFAFLTSLAREILKDAEDIRGDSATGCRTIAIVSGTVAAKRIVTFLNVVTIAFVFYVQIYLLRRDFNLLTVYFILAVQIPLIFFIHRLTKAANQQHYHFLSRFSKIIMVAGIFSMLLFFFYLRNGYVLF